MTDVQHSTPYLATSSFYRTATRSEVLPKYTDSPLLRSVGSPLRLQLTPVENLKGVSTYAISPDGRWLAYISPDEPAKKDEEDAPEYVKIWREKKELGRLRLLDLSGESKDTRTIVSVDFHVQSFTWSPDSTRILYRLVELPDWRAMLFQHS
ncbi:hypothetical protein C8J57DRAFT_387973 [Mycena rebaudengoi]|nr:hypothetical protein C8J57DRAFT_387973 [Mycena rebaudengoi]